MEEYVIINIKSVSFAIPCVCSPVESGEVARVTWRRGATLPKVATTYKGSRKDIIVYTPR